MAAKKNPVSFQNVPSAASSPAKPAPAEAVKAPVTATPSIVAPAPVAVAPAVAVTVTPAAAIPAVAVSVAPRTEAARDRSTIVALIAKLHDADAEVARDAAVTLGTLPADGEAVTALCNVLRNAENFFHSVVRAAAAKTLGQLKDARALDALLQATADTMAEASDEAVKSLGLLGDRRAIPTLEKIVRNEQEFFLEGVRKSAEESIRRIRG